MKTDNADDSIQAPDLNSNVDEQHSNGDKNRGFGSACCSNDTDCRAIELSGALSCETTQEEKIYCWNLIVDNCTGRVAQNVDFCLDVRSIQQNGEFVLGPGVFGPGYPPNATYSVDASRSIVGTVVPTYEGTGAFYKATRLPTGSSSLTVCAAFELPAPVLDFTQVLDSPFSVKPQVKNYNSCSTPNTVTNTVLIDGCDPSTPALHCPKFVEWSSEDTTNPPGACTDCALDGRIRFAVDTVTNCVTHICREGTWICMSGFGAPLFAPDILLQ